MSITGFIILWGVMALLSGICEMVYFGAEHTSNLQILMTGINWSEASGITGILTTSFDFAANWINALVGMLFFDFAFFQGEYMIFKYVIFFAISIGIIFKVIAMVRGTNT